MPGTDGAGQDRTGQGRASAIVLTCFLTWTPYMAYVFPYVGPCKLNKLNVNSKEYMRGGLWRGSHIYIYI